MEGDGEIRIDGRTSVRQVLSRYPSAAEVFERHGIMGCGGPEGPDEPLVFFALVHKVDPERLIDELREHIAASQGSRVTSVPRFGLPFALVPIGLAIAAALAGIPLGASLALLAARGEALDSRWTAAAQAYGQLQLMGWLGLFIVGMALHIVPRFKARPLAMAGWRTPLVLVWAAAVILRTATSALPQAWARPTLVASAWLQPLAALLFTAMVWLTLRGSRREPYDNFLRSALVGLVGGTCLQVAGVTQGLAAHSPYVPSGWDAAAVDGLAYGFVLPFVLGVSLRVVPFFLSLPATLGGYWGQRRPPSGARCPGPIYRRGGNSLSPARLLAVAARPRRRYADRPPQVRPNGLRMATDGAVGAALAVTGLCPGPRSWLARGGIRPPHVAPGLRHPDGLRHRLSCAACIPRRVPTKSGAGRRDLLPAQRGGYNAGRSAVAVHG